MYQKEEQSGEKQIRKGPSSLKGDQSKLLHKEEDKAEGFQKNAL